MPYVLLIILPAMISARALDALIKCLPPNVTTHFSSHVTGVENTGNGTVKLSIAPPSAHLHPEWPGEQVTFEATVAIGCDGIKSAVREALRHPGKLNGGQLRYTGTYAYRGLLDMEEAVKQIGEVARVPRMWLAEQKVGWVLWLFLFILN
jgi:salicylate hydroxylase